jgi:replicative DNA helicase
MNKKVKYNNRHIIEEVNSIVKKFEDVLGRNDQIWLQEKLDESLQNLLSKNVGTEVLSEFLFQKTPPHNIESETSLLARIILYPGIVLPQCTTLTSEHFYDVRHSLIWSSCKELHNKGKELTLDAVYVYLEANKKTEAAGGKRYLEAITKDCISDVGYMDRIKEVQDYFVLRGIWKRCAEAVHEAFNTNPDMAHEYRLKLIEDLSQLAQQQQKTYQDGVSLAQQMMEYIEKYEKSLQQGTGVTGLNSCVPELDIVTKGWQPTDLIIIAGRPGMGKTALAISDAAESVKEGIPIAFFSLEMSALQLAIRMFCIIKNYDLYTAVNYKKQELLTFVSEELPNLPIYIDDTPGVNWRYILDKSLAMKQKHGIKKIYVDYIQLMSGIDSRITNRENIVGENSRGLKIIAKSTGCPVFALSQLSRSCETRMDKRPLLSDLRDSGSIEQDADIVLFTYRSEYYKIFEDDYGNTEGIAELIISKHRNGALDTVKCFFNAPITRFTSLKNKPFNYTNQTNQHLKNSESESIDIDPDMPF